MLSYVLPHPKTAHESGEQLPPGLVRTSVFAAGCTQGVEEKGNAEKGFQNLPWGRSQDPFILRTSEEDIRSGIFNLVWVDNEVGGWLLKL